MPKGTLFEAEKKNHFWLLGALCLESRLRIRAYLRPFQSDLQQPSYNWSSGRCIGLKYALIVAAVVNKVQIIQQQSKD